MVNNTLNRTGDAAPPPYKRASGLLEELNGNKSAVIHALTAEGYTCSQIAEALDISYQSVRNVLMQDGEKNLRRVQGEREAEAATSEDTLTPEDKAADETAEADEGAVPGEEASLDETTGSDAIGGVDATLARTIETEPKPAPEPERASPSPQPEAQVVQHSGPGVMPLLLGGVIASALGYGAATLGLLPRQYHEDDSLLTALNTALEEQSIALAILAERASGIESQLAAPPEAPEMPEIPSIDLGPLEAQLAEIGTGMTGLDARLAALEMRMIVAEDGNADNSAASAAIATLQAELQEQQAANAGMAKRVAAAEAEAGARIAEAEARAETQISNATVQVALSELRSAVAAGIPFSSVLATIAESGGVVVPDVLTVIAETGVPTLEGLQADFPAVARAALPVALRESAGEDTPNRAIAFLRGHVGGRSLKPREGDDPDAVLSRAGAAVAAGDIAFALAEVAALPEGARDQMATWITDAETRLSATEALDTFSATLDTAE
ncbi:MAG: hypothetical protein GDA52_01935 [Rhodobacteraceae bacterium]|nr:hypothetical protein [Paracoccaceae bacterium]